MTISLLIILLISNAVSLKRDMSILFLRIVINSLVLIIILGSINLYLEYVVQDIELYSALFNTTTFTQIFNIFILGITFIIAVLYLFYSKILYKGINFYCYTLARILHLRVKKKLLRIKRLPYRAYRKVYNTFRKLKDIFIQIKQTFFWFIEQIRSDLKTPFYLLWRIWLVRFMYSPALQRILTIILTRLFLWLIGEWDPCDSMYIISNINPPSSVSNLPPEIPEAGVEFPENMDISNINIKNSTDPLFDYLRNNVRFAHDQVKMSKTRFLGFKSPENENLYTVNLAEREKHAVNLRCYLNDIYKKNYTATDQQMQAARLARAEVVLGPLSAIEPATQNISRRLYTSGDIYWDLSDRIRAGVQYEPHHAGPSPNAPTPSPYPMARDMSPSDDSLEWPTSPGKRVLSPILREVYGSGTEGGPFSRGQVVDYSPYVAGPSNPPVAGPSSAPVAIPSSAPIAGPSTAPVAAPSRETASPISLEWPTSPGKRVPSPIYREWPSSSLAETVPTSIPQSVPSSGGQPMTSSEAQPIPSSVGQSIPLQEPVQERPFKRARIDDIID